MSFRKYQVAMLIIGLYGSLFVGYKIVSSFGKKEQKVAVVESSHGSVDSAGEIPSVDSPAFDAWISSPGSVEKLIDSLK